MTSAVTDELIKDLRALRAQTTQGVWGKGQSTHETVARHPNAPPYHVADFRHANDASFIDACHEHLPAILDELEALRASAKVIEEARNDFKMEDGALADAIRDRIVGMEVSVDVCTCEEDAGHRYFGTVTEVMDGSSADKFGVVLLVQDAKPNYEVKK